MWAIFTRISEWLIQGSVRSALTGAGLGLGSAALSLTLIQNYINQLLQVGNSISADVLGLLALSGVHIALSGIIGSVVYRITASSAKLTLMRNS